MRSSLLIGIAAALQGLFASLPTYADIDVFSAARAGDADRVRTLLSETPGVRDARDAHQRTPLHAAAAALKSTSAAVLIEHGAAVDAVDDEGRTALHLAVLSGGETKETKAARVQIVRRLRVSGASVATADREGLLPLHLAALKGRTELLQWLLPEDATVDGRDHTGHTPLHYAALGGHVEVIKFLIENGASVSAGDKAGETALHVAARRCRAKAADTLLKEGADVNARNELGQTPLMLAASQGPAAPELDAAIVDLARHLLEHGAILDAKDEEGRTALDYAVLREHKQTADLLRVKGGGR